MAHRFRVGPNQTAHLQPGCRTGQFYQPPYSPEWEYGMILEIEAICSVLLNSEAIRQGDMIGLVDYGATARAGGYVVK